MATRRQVSIFINGREINNTLKSIYSEKRKINNELRQMVVGSEEYEKKIKEYRQINQIVDDHRQKLRGVEGTWNKLVKSGITKFAGLAAGAFAVDNIVRYGAQLFKLSAEMEVLGNKARTVFGDQLPRVTQEAERNAAAMGLTTREYIGAAAAIQDLLIPMGFQREEAANISVELTNLSGALSEWTGGQISSADVSRILSKALLGEREELKQLGIAIQEADVQTRLREKGLDKLTGTMLQQAKAAATLELITEKSVDAQTAYAENAGTLVRRQAEINAKFTEVSEKLATALIPVFERLLSMVDTIANGLLAFTGILGDASNETDRAAKSVANLQVQFNDEIETLARGNLSTENRKRLIQQINDRYKEYLPNLIKETDTIDDLRVAQAAANKAFEQRITLLAAEGQLADVAQRRIEAQTEELKLQRELTRRERELAEARANSNAGNTRQGIDYNVETAEQLLSRTNRAIEENKRVQQELRQEFDITREAAQKLGLDIQSILGGGNDDATESSIVTGGLSEKEISEIEKAYQKILDVIRKYQEEARLSKLDEDKRAIEQIKIKYKNELDLITELEEKSQKDLTAQRQELIRLRDEEISRFELELTEKKQEEKLARIEQEIEEENQKYIDGLIARDEAEKIIREQTDEVLLTERELQFQQLEQHYKELLELARQYGIDTTDIVRAYEKEKNEIRDNSLKSEEKRKRELELAEEELATARLGHYQEVFNGLNQLLGETEAAQVGLFLFEKGIAAAEVILNLQKELSAINATYSGIPVVGPAIAASLSTAAKIRSGIRLATIGATTIAGLIQKEEGGWHNVRGADDGKMYRAKYIGRQSTGLLPPHPVVLASEGYGKPEYFVSNKDLQNPVVLNYVRAIDNITKARQYQNGGVNNGPLPAPQAVQVPSAGVDPAQFSQMIFLLQDISGKLDSFNAVLEDDTLIGIINRMKKLQNAAGGIL